MSRQHTSRLAWLLAGVSLALAVGFGLLALLNRSVAEPYAPISALLSITFPVVGALIASRQPKNAVGWIFIGIGLSNGLYAFTSAYITYAPIDSPEVLPGAIAAAWLFSWVWAPGTYLLAFLLLLFPDGKLPGRRWRFALC